MDFGIHGGQGFLWPIPHRYQETAICTSRLSRNSSSFSLFCCGFYLLLVWYEHALQSVASHPGFECPVWGPLGRVAPTRTQNRNIQMACYPGKSNITWEMCSQPQVQLLLWSGEGESAHSAWPYPTPPPRGVSAECDEVQSAWQCQGDSGEKLQGCGQSEWNGLECGSGRWLLLKSSWW